MCEVANSMSGVLESERIGLSWNGLINFVEKNKDLYRIRLVKEDT